MKKNKMILAITALTAILLFIITIGVIKLMNYLNEPMTLFNSVISDTYSDFTSYMEDISKNELYSITNSKTVKIDADTKISIKGLSNSKYAKYQEAINGVSFVSTIKFSKTLKYFENNITATNNDEELINVTYLNTNYVKYLKPDVLSPFQRLGEENLDLKEIDATKNIYLGTIIKTEFLNLLKENDFKSEYTNLYINGKTYEARAISYEIKGEEILELLSNINTQINANSTVLTYVADLYGIKENKVSEKLNELFESFDIDSNATYNFVAYTEKSTDSTLKFALLDADKQELFSYVKSNTYRQYNYLSNNKTKSITIDGKINEDCKYVIKGDDATYEFSYNNTGSEITGDIKITNIEDNTVIVDGTYSCSYKTSNGITSMSLVIDYDYTCEKEIADVTINSSILINPNVDLNEISKSEYKNAYTAQNTDFSDIVISMLDTLNSKYNEQLGN